MGDFVVQRFGQIDYAVNAAGVGGSHCQTNFDNFDNMMNINSRGLDHAPEGMRCNAIYPVWVRTPLLDIELQKSPEVRPMIQAMVSIKRAAESGEVADTITYSLSPSASYINGTGVLLDAALTTTVRLF
ncbi:hypothetical protein BDV10DRAFT_192280 [Aspergillus recurvatus]